MFKYYDRVCKGWTLRQTICVCGDCCLSVQRVFWSFPRIFNIRMTRFYVQYLLYANNLDLTRFDDMYTWSTIGVIYNDLATPATQSPW